MDYTIDYKTYIQITYPILCLVVVVDRDEVEKIVSLMEGEKFHDYYTLAEALHKAGYHVYIEQGAHDCWPDIPNVITVSKRSLFYERH